MGVALQKNEEYKVYFIKGFNIKLFKAGIVRILRFLNELYRERKNLNR